MAFGSTRLKKTKLLLCSASLLLSTNAFCQSYILSWSTYTISVTGGGVLTYDKANLNCPSPAYDYLMSEFRNIWYTDTSGIKHGYSPIHFSTDNGNGYDGFCAGGPQKYGNIIVLPSNGNYPDINVNYVNNQASLAPLSGYVKLKYQILGVDYAPPGAKSSVNYAGSTMRGMSTSNSSTWTNTTNVTVTANAKANFLVFKAGTSASTSTSYQEEGDSSKSMTLSTTTSMADIIPGPLSSAAGVDHDYDVVWVWLNPELSMSIPSPNQLQWGGYAYDPQDDANEMEVVPIYVAELKDPSLMSTELAARLARSWDTSGLGGLTTQDYATILSADPLATNASFNPNTDTSGRYDIQAGQTFTYAPPPPGGQPLTQTYSIASQATSSIGKGGSHTGSVAMTVDPSFGIKLFAVDFSLDVKASDTYTWSNKWSSAINGGTGQTASLSITGPAATDNYAGPVTMQVWKDNVYGSFMFYPVK